MYKATVKFNSVMDAKDFVCITTAVPFKVDLVSDYYDIDAKSIMGVFSLDLSKPVELSAECDESDDFVSSIACFLVS